MRITGGFRRLRIEWCDRHLCLVTGSDVDLDESFTPTPSTLDAIRHTIATNVRIAIPKGQTKILT